MGIMSYNVKNVGLREEAKSGALIWRGWAAVGGGVGVRGSAERLVRKSAQEWDGKNRN